MRNPSSSPSKSIATFPDVFCGKTISSNSQPAMSQMIGLVPEAAVNFDGPDDDCAIEWSEEDVVLLHWRLLKEVGDLSDPEKPLEEKLDTLRWIFTEPDKENRPFSFVNCLKVVGCGPLSPTPYFGLMDAEEIRNRLRYQVKAWLNVTLARYPCWVREAVSTNPGWVEDRLAINPQWINEQIKRHAVEDDLFV